MDAVKFNQGFYKNTLIHTDPETHFEYITDVYITVHFQLILSKVQKKSLSMIIHLCYCRQAALGLAWVQVSHLAVPAGPGQVHCQSKGQRWYGK